MERIIEQVPFAPTPKKLLRVAAYARVSSGKDAMLHSLSAQISYYSDLIQHHPGWQFAGVYADEAKTGTRDSRENFQRLLEDCRAGQVNMVIVKSISRFARNTVTLLSTIRELKALGVDIYFEEQNIHTMSADGELVLSILASYAQEESLSVSENQKWRIRKNFEEGKPWNNNMYGYRQDNGVLTIVPEEAAVVRRVFDLYLSGMGVVAITKRLRAEGFGWSKTCIEKMLKNYTYTGNLLLQRRFRSDHISKKSMKNIGQKPMYHAADTHEAIIPLSVFEAVQDEMHQRSEHYKGDADKPPAYPLSGKIVCSYCGKHYRRKKTRDRVVWQCLTYNVYGKEACPCGRAIPEPILESLTADIALDDLTEIRAEEDNRLVFCFKDGSERVKRWQDRSRAKSWTPEMKEAARQKTLERHKQDATLTN